MDQAIEERNEHIRCMRCIKWSMQDAEDALTCAVGLKDWNGVIKYANQIKDMERQLQDHERAIARAEREKRFPNQKAA